MKTFLIIFLTFLMIFSSCSKDSNGIQYPKTFIFHHSTITEEKGFVFGDNQTYTEIDSKAGNLGILRNLKILDIYHYIKTPYDSIPIGRFLESITLLSKDSVRINFSQSNQIESFTFSANVDDPNGELIDKADFEGSTVKYNKSTQEITICLAASLGIVKLWAVPFFTNEYCLDNHVYTELVRLISDVSFAKNDSLGIYLMDMVYRE